jgi:hypothetical protein
MNSKRKYLFNFYFSKFNERNVFLSRTQSLLNHTLDIIITTDIKSGYHFRENVSI